MGIEKEYWQSLSYLLSPAQAGEIGQDLSLIARHKQYQGKQGRIQDFEMGGEFF